MDHPAEHGTRWRMWSVVLVVTLAAVLRLLQIRESLWVDELHTGWIAADTILDVPPRARICNQSPLFYYLPWFTTRMFGTDELTLRLPSLLAGLALVFGLYWLVRNWTNDHLAGLLAATLAAIDPTCVFYAQEARSYSTVQLAALGHVAALSILLQHGRQATRLPHIGFVFSGALLFHAHYTAALLFVADAVILSVLLCQAKWRQKLQWGWLALDLGVIAGICLAEFPHLRMIAARGTNWSAVYAKPEWRELFTLLPILFYIGVPLGELLFFKLFVARQDNEMAATSNEKNDSSPSFHSAWLVSVCWLLVPLLIAFVLSQRNDLRIFTIRYLLPSAVAPMVFAGLCQHGVTKVYWRWLLFGATCLGAGYNCNYWREFPATGRLLNYRMEDWRAAVMFINQHSSGKEPVFVCPNFIEDSGLVTNNDPLFRDFCASPLLGPYRLRQAAHDIIPLPTTTAPRFSEAFRRQIRDAGSAWLIVRGVPEIARHVAGDLRSHQTADKVQYHLQKKDDEFGWLTILKVTVAPPTAEDASR